MDQKVLKRRSAEVEGSLMDDKIPTKMLISMLTEDLDQAITPMISMGKKTCMTTGQRVIIQN